MINANVWFVRMLKSGLFNEFSYCDPVDVSIDELSSKYRKFNTYETIQPLEEMNL